MQAGRNVLAKQHQARVAVTLRYIAKHLIVGAVLLDDVDHMRDLAGLQTNPIQSTIVGADSQARGNDPIVLQYLVGKGGQFVLGGTEIREIVPIMVFRSYQGLSLNCHWT